MELSDVEKKCANLTGLYISTGGIQEIPELGIAVAGEFYKFLWFNVNSGITFLFNAGCHY